MPDIPNVKFINMVDTKAQIDYNQHGEAPIPINQAQSISPLDVSEFRKITVRIGTCKAQSASMHIGKISGPTLAVAYDIPLNNNAHTFDVIGPQMTLWLKGGPPNTGEKVQVWVYLRS